LLEAVSRRTELLRFKQNTAAKDRKCSNENSYYCGLPETKCSEGQAALIKVLRKLKGGDFVRYLDLNILVVGNTHLLRF
jgi:hypothetical protein